MKIYLHELRFTRKSTFIWTLSLALVVILYMNMFPAFSNDASLMEQILKNFPEEFRKAFGLSDFKLSTFLGFYGYIFSYILLCGAIQAMNLGLGILSKEVTQKTADFLLVKPISRKKIVTFKLMSAITNVIITNIIFIIISFFTSEVMLNVTYDKKIYLMISLTLLFIQIIFISIGFIVAVLLNKIKSVLPISLGITFGLFILDMFGSVIGEEKIKYITPFKYFDIKYIIDNGKYDYKFLFLSITLVIIFISGSYYFYSKKDISQI